MVPWSIANVVAYGGILFSVFELDVIRKRSKEYTMLAVSRWFIQMAAVHKYICATNV